MVGGFINKLLERAYQERCPYLSQIKTNPLYDSLRSEPRFENLLQRMNFPE